MLNRLNTAGKETSKSMTKASLSTSRDPYKMRIFICIIHVSSPNPMFDHLTHPDDSNKWSKIGFGEEITQVELIDVNFTHLIWSSD